MKNEIIHVDSYAPTITPTWLIKNFNIYYVEQIRVLTCSSPDDGHRHQIEYVYSDSFGRRGVWNTNEEPLSDHIEPLLFVGDEIDWYIFNYIYQGKLNIIDKQGGTLKRLEVYDNLVCHCDEWNGRIRLSDDIFKQCSFMDSKAHLEGL